jgi:hypothetical protein
VNRKINGVIAIDKVSNYFFLMRKIISIVALLFTFISIPLLPANAAVKAGTACKPEGITSVVSGKTYTCIKSGNKIIWNSGVSNMQDIGIKRFLLKSGNVLEDKGFANKGNLIINNLSTYNLAQSSNGDFIIVGFSGPPGDGKIYLLEFSSTGILKEDFGKSGILAINPTQFVNQNFIPLRVSNILFTPDGNSIYVVGTKNLINDKKVGTVIKLNSKGLDSNFGTSGIFELSIPEDDYTNFESAGLDASGNLLIGGYTQKYGYQNPNYFGNTNTLLIRLDSLGSLDKKFTPTGYLQPSTINNFHESFGFTFKTIYTNPNGVTFAILDATYDSGSLKRGLYSFEINRNMSWSNSSAAIQVKFIGYPYEGDRFNIRGSISAGNNLYIYGETTKLSSVSVGNSSDSANNSVSYQGVIMSISENGQIDNQFADNGVFYIKSNIKSTGVVSAQNSNDGLTSFVVADIKSVPYSAELDKTDSFFIVSKNNSSTGNLITSGIVHFEKQIRVVGQAFPTNNGKLLVWNFNNSGITFNTQIKLYAAKN